MKLLTKTLENTLFKNGAINARHMANNGNTEDFKPVVKFFNPCGGATWLFSELDADKDTLFGLCALGHGSPEIGNASLSMLKVTTLPLGLKIERDRWFKADKTLTEYANAAQRDGYINA